MPEVASKGNDADGSGSSFSSTQWSMVLNARSSSASRREALESLCKCYWLPIYGYLRRRGNSASDAEDLTQGFFAYLLESDFLERPDPAKGRFRGYLLGALRHYLGSHFGKENAIKRGGGAHFVDWSSLDAEREYAAVSQKQLDPSECYETSWAMALLARAHRRLEQEQAASGRSRQLSVLKGFISEPPADGDYDSAARELGTTRTNVAVWVHRLTHRYGELVKLEVAATLQDPAELKSEMQHLFKVLQAPR